jgi:hypothetical protein
VDKGPFEQPKTSVTVREVLRDDDTGEATLHLKPVNGDVIYWEVGGQASTASARLNGSELTTRELRLSFLCVDSSGPHETGDPVTWQNRITLKYRLYQRADDKMIELRAAPLADMRYTTDGSDPKLGGARYLEEFAIPPGAPLVQAYAERDGIVSEMLRVPIDWDDDDGITVDAELPARLVRPQTTASTQETYTWLESLGKFKGATLGLTVTVGGNAGVRDWLELTASDEKGIAPGQIAQALEPLRRIQTEGQVTLQVTALQFALGQDLLDWVAESRLELRPGEVIQ